MKKITDKLYSWASILEPQAQAQACRTASMPFIWPHMALMPDAHLGKGATVGSVIPALGAIMPAAVGVDIGCGMRAVLTQFMLGELSCDLTPLREAIQDAVPLSAGRYNTAVSSTARARVEELEAMPGAREASKISPNWHLQLGTLGSGNHFIEVSADETGRVWLFLHSGSRGAGNKLATGHIKIAQEMCRGERLPDPDLAYLAEGTPEFDAYIRDLRWAQHFALLNRAEMMDRVIACFSWWMNVPVRQEEIVQCHHNYTEQADLQGRRVWLSRKGAIDASAGRQGLIPGSMGTASYVVEGRGDELSLNSAPHGAGRSYSRGAAKRTFTRAQLEEAMKGIEWRHTDAFLDEIPAAYKDIGVVMADAADLVRIRHTLHQVVNVKGD